MNLSQQGSDLLGEIFIGIFILTAFILAISIWLA